MEYKRGVEEKARNDSRKMQLSVAEIINVQVATVVDRPWGLPRTIRGDRRLRLKVRRQSEVTRLWRDAAMLD